MRKVQMKRERKKEKEKEKRKRERQTGSICLIKEADSIQIVVQRVVVSR